MGFPILVRWHLYIESAPWANWWINGLVQYCSNSSALAMELLQSGTRPSTWWAPGLGMPTCVPFWFFLETQDLSQCQHCRHWRQHGLKQRHPVPPVATYSAWWQFLLPNVIQCVLFVWKRFWSLFLCRDPLKRTWEGSWVYLKHIYTRGGIRGCFQFI